MKKFGFTAPTLAALAATVLVAACSKTPGSPSVSFTSPVATQPANGTAFKFRDQPVTLTITNAVRTGSATATYSVEVATDSGFANKVFTKDGVTEGSGTTTALTVSNLTGGATYYWHWRATVDGITGPPSPTQSFSVAQQIILGVPTPVSPASGGVSSDPRPTFTVTNSARSGSPSSVSYEFQVSTSAGFTSITASATVAEQSGRTSWTPSSDLPTSALFWRARALAPADGETSSFAGATAFSVQPFNAKQALFLNNPGDVADWTENAKITSIDFNSDALIVEFDKRTGPGSWIEAGFGTDGGIQYTLGMCFNISNQWYCSAPIQFWAGRDLEAAGSPSAIAQNWYYDPARWGPMAGHQPVDGELVAIWAGHGNLRGNGNNYHERTNFVLVKFGEAYRAK